MGNCVIQAATWKRTPALFNGSEKGRCPFFKNQNVAVVVPPRCRPSKWCYEAGCASVIAIGFPHRIALVVKVERRSVPRLRVREEGAQASREQYREYPKADVFGSHNGIVQYALELLSGLVFVCRGYLIERRIALLKTNAHSLQGCAQEQADRGVPKESRNNSDGLH